ncbi:MAG: enterochelin esterase domain-containing protein [Escherichia coli]
MQRIAGTDVWQWTTQLNANGAAATALFLPNAMTFFLHHPPIALDYAKAENYYPVIADPLNPQSWKGGRGTLFLHSKCRKRLCNRDGIVRKRQK